MRALLYALADSGDAFNLSLATVCLTVICYIKTNHFCFLLSKKKMSSCEPQFDKQPKFPAQARMQRTRDVTQYSNQTAKANRASENIWKHWGGNHITGKPFFPITVCPTTTNSSNVLASKGQFFKGNTEWILFINSLHVHRIRKVKIYP